jgi:hypothetical protein
VIVSVAAVLTVAVFAGAAAVAWDHLRPRLPPVRLFDASTDAGIVAVVDAAGADAAVTVTVPVPTTSCQRPLFEHGHIYTRTANLYTDAGSENALITRIAAGLPPSYHASRANPLGSPVAPIHAVPGPGVQLVVQVISPGWISATAQTACSTASGATPPGNPGGAVPATIAALFAPLRTTAAAWHTESVPCGRGAITTVDAISAQTDSSGIAGRLAAAVPADARRYTTPSNRIIWRSGSTSTLVAASDDGVHVTAQITTSTC